MGEEDQPARAKSVQDYRNLPTAVSLDETIASVDPGAAPDPHAGRNVDQHQALRDD